MMTMVAYIIYKVIIYSNTPSSAPGKQQGFCERMFSPLVWVSCPLHPELLPAQRNRPPKASISRKGHLVPSWPLPTDAHLLKPVTTHTFASAGAWPHAAPTIWTKRFKKKNHQYHLSTAHKIVAVLEKTQEEERRGKSIGPYATRLGKFGHGYGRNGIRSQCLAFQRKYKQLLGLCHLLGG